MMKCGSLGWPPTRDSSECLEDVHCRGEATYQSLIAIEIFFEGLLPSWSNWRMAANGFLEYTSCFGVVSQGIDNQLDVRGRGWYFVQLQLMT